MESEHLYGNVGNEILIGSDEEGSLMDDALEPTEDDDGNNNNNEDEISPEIQANEAHDDGDEPNNYVNNDLNIDVDNNNNNSEDNNDNNNNANNNNNSNEPIRVSRDVSHKSVLERAYKPKSPEKFQSPIDKTKLRRPAPRPKPVPYPEHPGWSNWREEQFERGQTELINFHHIDPHFFIRHFVQQRSNLYFPIPTDFEASAYANSQFASQQRIASVQLHTPATSHPGQQNPSAAPPELIVLSDHPRDPRTRPSQRIVPINDQESCSFAQSTMGTRERLLPLSTVYASADSDVEVVSPVSDVAPPSTQSSPSFQAHGPDKPSTCRFEHSAPAPVAEPFEGPSTSYDVAVYVPPVVEPVDSSSGEDTDEEINNPIVSSPKRKRAGKESKRKRDRAKKKRKRKEAAAKRYGGKN